MRRVGCAYAVGAGAVACAGAEFADPRRQAGVAGAVGDGDGVAADGGVGDNGRDRPVPGFRGQWPERPVQPGGHAAERPRAGHAVGGGEHGHEVEFARGRGHDRRHARPEFPQARADGGVGGGDGADKGPRAVGDAGRAQPFGGRRAAGADLPEGAPHQVARAHRQRRRHRDQPVHEPLRPGIGRDGQRQSRPRRLPGQGHVARVRAECGGVVPHPLQGDHHVVDGAVRDLFAAFRRVPPESLELLPVPQCHGDDAGLREPPRAAPRFGWVALLVPAAVDPQEDGPVRRGGAVGKWFVGAGCVGKWTVGARSVGNRIDGGGDGEDQLALAGRAAIMIGGGRGPRRAERIGDGVGHGMDAQHAVADRPGEGSGGRGDGQALHEPDGNAPDRARRALRRPRAFTVREPSADRGGPIRGRGYSWSA